MTAASPHDWGLPEMFRGVSTKPCTRCPARWWDGQDEPAARCISLPTEAVDPATAKRLTGESTQSTLDLLAWLPADRYRISDQAGTAALYVATAGGYERVWFGDWIVRTAAGALKRLTDCEYRDLTPSSPETPAPGDEGARPGSSPTGGDVCEPGRASKNVPL